MALTIAHFILNVIALLLWVNWISFTRDAVPRTPGTQLIATLKKAGPKGFGRWKFLIGIAALLGLRALIYWQLGPALKWTPRLNWGFVSLTFRGDEFMQLLAFSVLGFLLVLGAFYFWLLLISVANRTMSDADPIQTLVRHYFKWFESWPSPLKLVLPLILGALTWLAVHPLLDLMLVTTGEKFSLHLVVQSLLVGLGGYLVWKYLVVTILLLHVLSSYVYFGDHAVWKFVAATAQNLMRPLRWIPTKIGRVDFLPLITIALVFFLAEIVANPANWPATLRKWL